MNVQAVNTISLAPKFEGGVKKTANNQTNNEYPQMDAPMSKDAAKAYQSMVS